MPRSGPRGAPRAASFADFHGALKAGDLSAADANRLSIETGDAGRHRALGAVVDLVGQLPRVVS